MTEVKGLRLSPIDEKVLRRLVRSYDYDGCSFIYFRTIAADTKLKIAEVRRACRRLKRKGLAEYCRGLFDDDGKVAGSGYGATSAGRDLIQKDQN